MERENIDAELLAIARAWGVDLQEEVAAAPPSNVRQPKKEPVKPKVTRGYDLGSKGRPPLRLRDNREGGVPRRNLRDLTRDDMRLRQ